MAEPTKLYQNLRPQFEGDIGPPRRGRRARYSFLATGENGAPVRRWHGVLPVSMHERVPGSSLRGMVKP